jgi:hypothetical protein
MTTFIGMASFGVDVGRIQLVKTEMRRAADAAARAGADALDVSQAQAYTDAVSWSKKNFVNNAAMPDSGITVTVGYWNKTSRIFSNSAPSGSTANAVRVQLNRPAAGADSVPLIWGSILGVNGCQVRVEAIAMLEPGLNVDHQVDGVANPFLSGMPAGSVASMNNPHNSPDYAGNASSTNLAARKQSPPVVPMPVTPGDVLEFDSIAGTVRHDPNLPYFSPDGELSDVSGNTNGSENGIADTSAPINALVGLFLNDNAPNRTATPTADRSFSTEAGRNFDQLNPQLKQIFFIGDGATSGGTKQRFVVPPGATRLFLATWDFYEWNNNAGYRIVKVKRPGRVVLVK